MVKKDKQIEDKKTKDLDESKKNIDDEPSWYHYVIVLIFFVLLFYGIYILLGLDSTKGVKMNNNISNTLETYDYTYEEDGKKYNFKFNSPVNELREYDVPIELNKYDLLNSDNIIFVFLDYNTSDNKYISISSVKLMRLIKYYFKFDFSKEDFKMISNYSCMNSTLDNKVIIFDPYKNSTGVYYNQSNGCININSNNASNLVKLTDKLMLDLINS